MGLFDLFRNRRGEDDEPLSQVVAENVREAQRADVASIVSEIVDSFNKDMVGGMFPGGKAQAVNVAVSIARILGKDPERCDKDMFRKILTERTGVHVRNDMMHMSEDRIIEYLLKGTDGLVPDRTAAKRILTFHIKNMKDPAFVVKTQAAVAELDQIPGPNTFVDEIAVKNLQAQKEGLNDPMYGLVKEKPIYTHGVRASYEYLEALRAEDGSPLEWKRLGSIRVEGIDGLIDVYQSFKPSGEEYKTLYVNMYGTENSRTIPNGFK